MFAQIRIAKHFKRKLVAHSLLHLFPLSLAFTLSPFFVFGGELRTCYLLFERMNMLSPCFISLTFSVFRKSDIFVQWALTASLTHRFGIFSTFSHLFFLCALSQLLCAESCRFLRAKSKLVRRLFLGRTAHTKRTLSRKPSHLSFVVSELSFSASAKSVEVREAHAK